MSGPLGGGGFFLTHTVYWYFCPEYCLVRRPRLYWCVFRRL